MSKFLTNGFSFNMIDITTKDGFLNYKFLPKEQFMEEIKDAISFVGHYDLAHILGVEYNRRPLKLVSGDILYILQISKGHLPVGCDVLPDNVVYKFVKVEIC